MNKFYLFLIPLVLVSCSGMIKTVRDDFKNATILTMDLREGSEESVMKGGGTADFQYLKEIKNNQPSLTTITIFIKKERIPFSFGRTNLDMERQVIIKVDDKSYEIILNDMSMVNVNKVSMETDFVTGTTELSSSDHKNWKARLQLTKQIENDILKANSVAIRLYFGTMPMTFVLYDLEKVKEFIGLTKEPEN